jgi:tRNA-Thr(GGU) m(6)t(6)A37 methyltransferase TsaA
MAELRSLVLEPIGYISTPFQSKAEAPHQPDLVAATEGVITLLGGQNFEQALEDLEGIEKIWLLYWFDQNPNWKPKVLVPRGERKKRGLFATRSPHRPNPIGMSLVDLVEVRGLHLRVRNVDLLDGTPIFDIKPYLPSVEAWPNAKAGWIDEVDEAPRFTIEYSDLAKRQLDLLLSHKIDLEERIERVLSRDPTPHPYKRIERIGDEFEQAVRGWRIRFAVDGQNVIVREIRSGYSTDVLERNTDISDEEAQRAFFDAYPAA